MGTSGIFCFHQREPTLQKESGTSTVMWTSLGRRAPTANLATADLHTSRTIFPPAIITTLDLAWASPTMSSAMARQLCAVVLEFLTMARFTTLSLTRVGIHPSTRSISPFAATEPTALVRSFLTLAYSDPSTGQHPPSQGHLQTPAPDQQVPALGLLQATSQVGIP